MSSRAYLVDLIHSIGEKLTLADHLEEELLGENENQEDLKAILAEVLNLRREQMSDLLSKGIKPNPHFHCAMKHAIKSFVLDSEVYEATLTDEDFENLKKSADILAMVASKYLGMDEMTTCSRCFADMLLVKEHDS